jgi:N-acetylglucosamine-6-phosphate deacetylase
LEAPSGFQSLEEVYGPENLVESEDWTTSMSADQGPAVRLITAAPEVPGIMGAIGELNKRGIAFSIGHRFAALPLDTVYI